MVGRGRELAGVRHRAAGEALESGGARVDAERHAVAGQLLLDELVQSLLHLAHARQLRLPHVVEHLLKHHTFTIEVTLGDKKRMPVRMKYVVLCCPPQIIIDHFDGTHLGGGLEVPGVLPHAGRGGDAAGAHAGVVAEAALVQVRVVQRLAHADPLLGVQGQHLAQQVDGLVRGRGAEGVERRDGGRLAAPRQHVSLGGLAGVLHVGEGGCAQQVRDQLQLLDRGGGLQHKQVRSRFREAQ